MEVLRQDLEGFTQSISFKFDASQMDSKFNREISQLKNKVRISGFRPGKVPTKVIRQRYGASIINDLQSDAVQESWRHMINDLKLVPLSQPDLDVSQPFRPGKDLEFTFSFDVIPPFDLPKPSSLEGEIVTWSVSEARVDQEIQRLCDLQGEWVALKRRKKCREGDLITVALKGFEGDEEIDSLNSAEEKFELGQQRIIPALEKAISGLKAEDSFSAEHTFEDDHPNEQLRGKTIRFEGSISDIQEKKALTVEELIEKVPDENEAALRTRLADELKTQKQQESQGELRDAVAKQLREGSDFALPPKAVEDQTHSRLHHQHGHAHGETCDHNHSTEEEAEARAKAEADLRFEAIVRQYSQENGLSVSESDFTGKLLEMLRSAGQYGMELIQFYQQPANRDRLKAAILDDMVIDSYIDAAGFKTVDRELGVED